MSRECARGFRSPIAGAIAAISGPLLALAPVDAAGATAPVVECRRVAASEAPRINGDLGDPAWQAAVWFADFRQSVPELGASASERTAVAFLFDDRHVYVAIRCDDSSPGLIRANKLRHRDEPDSDDHVQVIFDTYRDQVRGTIFVVNPNGAKEEGLVNGYERYTWSWNEVWEAKAAITANGWQVELAIPLRLLRYGNEPAQEWGVNVERVVRRTQEEVYLSPPPPPFDISSLNFAATLTGLELGERQRNLQVIPYALGGTVDERGPAGGEPESRTIGELGVDLKYSITSDLTLDATYNTDFAQVESDDEQVNLTRFSLFYPEKREFFLENAQLFSFGSGGGPHGTSLTPFFSRRIGLHEGATVPIDVGARLTGKVGREDIGVLSVRTDAVDDLGLDSAWYNVARVRHDLGGRSYLGGIVTDSRRGDFRSTTLGLDAGWYLTPSLEARGYYLRVDERGGAGDGGDDPTDAWDLELDYTTDPWGFLFAFTEVDEGFDPDLGYVQREGYRKPEGILRRSFRPGRWGIRRVSLRASSEWYDSLAHDLRESSQSGLSCELELENGDDLTLEVERSFERLFEPFALDDELVFAPGSYTFTGASFGYESDRSRRWGLDAEAEVGEFYDGDGRQLGADLWLVLSRHFRIEGSYSTYDVDTDHGDIGWRLWSLRLAYTHSATLSAATFVQYNSSTGTSIVNLRLRWILPNDSDVFLVLNQRSEEREGAPTVRGHDAAIKASYRFFL